MEEEYLSPIIEILILAVVCVFGYINFIKYLKNKETDADVAYKNYWRCILLFSAAIGLAVVFSIT